MILTCIPTHPGTDKGQHGAQSFAATVDQVGRKIRDHGDIRAQSRQDQLVDGFHILCNQPLQIADRLLTVLALIFERDDNTHKDPQANNGKSKNRRETDHLCMSQ